MVLTMMGQLKIVAFMMVCGLAVEASNQKALSFFNVVKFPNDVCKGNGNRNGTCYTAEECSDRGGTSGGSCADGFGVCCIIQINCGQTSSENCTYLVSDTESTSKTNCDYRICPINRGVCRIKFELTTFTIASPFTVAATADSEHKGPSIGDCLNDVFYVSAGSVGTGSPQICGQNTGQHLFVDTDGMNCATASFTFGAGASTTRSYDIKVLQYDCRNEMGGPPGCLQYFTSKSGTYKSFNFVTAASADSVHLSNQNYDICFRRVAGACVICHAAGDNDFGLSLSPDAAAKSDVTNCVNDYIEIEGGQATATANAAAVTAGLDRFCGRFLNVAGALAEDATVCTARTPFKVSVVTNNGEVGSATDMAKLAETSKTPRGNLGFQIAFDQTNCA